MAPGRRRLMGRATCIYDGDCGFCRRSVVLGRGLVGDRVDFQPSQEVAWDYPEIAPEAFERSLQFVDEDRQVSEGAEAVFRCLERAPGLAWLLLFYQRVPGFKTLTEAVYSAVANHRQGASRLSRWLVGPQVKRHSLLRVRWLLLRLMALIYLMAFGSLIPQLLGLIGSDGILPFDQLLQSAANQPERLRNFPTLLWLSPTNQALMALAYGGLFSSVLLLLGLLPRISALLCWLFYLSIYSVAQNFLWLQWDILLLEAGFLTLLLAPWGLRPGLAKTRPPRWITLFLFRWLCFRLVFSSGVVKLLSGDPTWAQWTALLTHFETQPLPNLGAWWAHQLPSSFLVLSVGLTLACELFVPFLFLGPRRLRFVAGLISVGLMVGILVTGNYGFFNWLSLVLCIALLDDDHLLWLGRRMRRQKESTEEPDPRRVPLAPAPGFSVWAWGLGLLLVYSSLAQMLTGFRMNSWWTEPGAALAHWSRHISLINNYGLFATMTDARPPEAAQVCAEQPLDSPCDFVVSGLRQEGSCSNRYGQVRCEPQGGRLELIIQGSDDRKTWLDYKLPYKPQDPNEAPRQIAPHMPRLDWLLWFAALRQPGKPPNWFRHLLLGILEGRAGVLSLFQHDPFKGRAPLYLRVQMREYRFNRSTAPPYWLTRPRGSYFGPVHLPARSP